MNIYRDFVDNLVKNKSNETFDNKGSDHAAIVVSKMLDIAERSIYFYTGSFDAQVTENIDVLSAIERVIKKPSIDIKVLIEEIPLEKNQSKALQKLIQAKKNQSNIEIKEVHNDNFLKENNIGHFLVVDNKAYRYEIDMNEFKAICNFNDNKNIAKNLQLLFLQEFNF